MMHFPQLHHKGFHKGLGWSWSCECGAHGMPNVHRSLAEKCALRHFTKATFNDAKRNGNYIEAMVLLEEVRTRLSESK